MKKIKSFLYHPLIGHLIQKKNWNTFDLFNSINNILNHIQHQINNSSVFFFDHKNYKMRIIFIIELVVFQNQNYFNTFSMF